MITEAKFYRGAFNKTFTGTYTHDVRRGYACRLSGSSTPVVQMQDATTTVPDKHGVFWNVGGTTIDFHDNGGTSFGTIAASAAAALVLFDNSTADGEWGLFPLTLL